MYLLILIKTNKDFDKFMQNTMISGPYLQNAISSVQINFVENWKKIK